MCWRRYCPSKKRHTNVERVRVASGNEKNSSPGSMSECLIELLKDSCGRNESE